MTIAFDITDPIFHDEAKATAHMEADRWPDGVYCPLCGSVNVHKMGGKTQAGMFVCYGCEGVGFLRLPHRSNPRRPHPAEN
jgi:hypothetical protein